MPKKIQNTTKAHLVSVPLPNHGATYTVISHQFVIDYAYQALAAAGFGIVDEEYRCTSDGQIAQGIYKLNFNNDPELSMMFAWTNSYNKQVKFKCVVGAYINKTGGVMISGEVGSWVRKHTGTADTEVKDTIDQYISNAYMYYNQLCSDKAAMEVINLNKRKQSQLLGVLFAEYEILTTEQASAVRDQMKKPYHVFTNTDSLWAFYNYVTNALQSSHPKTWMEDQRILHYFIGTICDFSTPPIPNAPVSTPTEDLSTPVDPLTTNYGQPENQTNLLVQIAEVTGDDSVLEPSLPVEPADYDFTQTVDYSKAINPVTEDQVFQNIKEVTEQALQDELVFGISGVAVSAEGVRNVPIEEVLEEMQKSDNQVVQDDPEMLEIVHQVDEILETLDEAEEDVFVTEDGIEVTEEELPWDNDEVIGYTDPDGNTFEAPVVNEVKSLQPTAEDYEQFQIDEVREHNDPIANTFETSTVNNNLDETFAEEDNFDLDFNETDEDSDSVPDFF